MSGDRSILRSAGSKRSLAGAAAIAALLGVIFAVRYEGDFGSLPDGVLGRVAGVDFDREDLETYLGREAEFGTLSDARRAVNRFVGNQLLALAARERGESVDGLLERLVEERGASEAVREEEVRARYARDQHLYERERTVRLAYAGVPLSAGSSDDETRRDSPDELRRLAEEIVVRARLHPAKAELALWIPRDEKRAYALESGPWSCVPGESERPAAAAASMPPPALLAAACELREGRLTPLIATEDGFYVAKVRRRTRAWRIPYAKLARSLRADIERERLVAARERESTRLRNRARIRLANDAIADLVVPGETFARAIEQPGPPSPPGFAEDS